MITKIQKSEAIGLADLPELKEWQQKRLIFLYQIQKKEQYDNQEEIKDNIDELFQGFRGHFETEVEISRDFFRDKKKIE